MKLFFDVNPCRWEGFELVEQPAQPGSKSTGTVKSPASAGPST